MILEFELAIDSETYSNSNWNVNIYIYSGNNKIFLLNYNSSYNFAHFANSNYYNGNKPNLHKVIRTKVITSSIVNEPFSLSLEF